MSTEANESTTKATMMSAASPRPLPPLWPGSVLDVRSLALFRILLGLYLLYDLYTRLSLGVLDLSWYTSEGYLSVGDTPHGAPLHRIWFYRGSDAMQKHLFQLTVLVVLVFLLHDSRFVKVSLFLLVTSYQNRNMWLHDGSDSFVRHLLFWSIFLPLHEVWSLSAFKNEPSVAIGDKRKRTLPPSPPGSITSLACGALTLQIVLMYWGTVAHRVLDDESRSLKLGDWLGAWWTTHESEWMPPKLTAVHYALSGDFAVRSNWLVSWVRSRPALTRAMTSSAMIVETLVPLFCLLDPRRRHLHALQLAMLHVGLLALIRLPNWQLVGVLTQVLWIPTFVWDSLLKVDRMGLAKKKDMMFDESSPRNYATALEVHSSRRTNPVSFVIQVFFLIYMMYNWCGCRGWIEKLDRGDIGEGVRLSQYWVMFGTVSHTAHNVHLHGTAHDTESNETVTIDLLRFISSGERVPPHERSPVSPENDGWFLPDMSDRYPSPRWERALAQWAAKSDSVRARRLGQRLCTLLPLELDSIQVRYTHAQIAPPGSDRRFHPAPSLPDTVVTVACPTSLTYT